MLIDSSFTFVSFRFSIVLSQLLSFCFLFGIFGLRLRLSQVWLSCICGDQFYFWNVKTGNRNDLYKEKLNILLFLFVFIFLVI